MMTDNGENIVPNQAIKMECELSLQLIDAPVVKSSARRTRARRNPVWQHFRVEDGLAICANCDYSTRSVFSTNLKVHLKSHHALLYEMVRETEQRLNNQAISPNLSETKSDYESGKGSISPPGADSCLISPQSISTKEEHPDAILFGASTPQECLNANLENVLRNASAQLNNANDNNYNAYSNNNNNNNNSIGELLNFANGTPAAAAAALNILNGATSLSAYNGTVDDDNAAKMSLFANLCASANGTTSTPSIEALGDSNAFDLLMNSIASRRALGLIGADENRCYADEDLTGGAENFRTTKRKRLRRHPVWRFFKDVDEKTVGCVTCNFKTRSAFSTNLKMHLRAHHKEQYLSVMEMELEQCNLENNTNTASSHLDNNPNASGNNGTSACDEASFGLRRLKRKRKSVEEIRGIINKCKVTMAKERQRVTPSMVSASSNANVGTSALGGTTTTTPPADMTTQSAKSILPALAFLQAIRASASSRSDANPSIQHAQSAFDNCEEISNPLTPDQFNAMLGVLLKNNISSNNNYNFDNNNNNHTMSDDAICDSVENKETNFVIDNGADNECDEKDAIQLDEIRRLFDFCGSNSTTGDKLLRSVVLKQAIDLTAKRIVSALGSPKILGVPAFRLLISAISPEYDWSHIDSMQ